LQPAGHWAAGGVAATAIERPTRRIGRKEVFDGCAGAFDPRE